MSPQAKYSWFSSHINSGMRIGSDSTSILAEIERMAYKDLYVLSIECLSITLSSTFSLCLGGEY